MPCCRTQTHTGTWDGCKGVSLKMWKMKMIICNIFYKTPHGYIWSEERSWLSVRDKEIFARFLECETGRQCWCCVWHRDRLSSLRDPVCPCHASHLSLVTNWSRISWHQTKFLLYIWPEITTKTAPEVSCSRLNESLHRQWRETERDSHVACVRCDTWHQCIDQHYHCQLSPPLISFRLPSILSSFIRKQWY